MADKKEYRLLFKNFPATRKELEEKLKFQLQFEKLVGSISSRFVNIDANKIDEAINKSLQQAGNFFKLDRCIIYQFSSTGEIMGNTYEWHAEGIEPIRDFYKHLSLNAIPWMLPQLREMSAINIPDVSKLPPEAKAEKKGFMRQGLQSLLMLPFSIKAGSNALGFLGFDSLTKKREWTEEQIGLLKIVAETIAAALSRRQLEMQRNYTEKVLKESEERYRTIVENINDALFISDFNGTIIDLNETACRMSGYKRDELIGANLNMLRSLQDQKLVFQRTKQLFKDNKLLVEGTMIHQNGASIPVEISMKIVSHAGCGLFHAFVRDITRRKRTEQEIAAYTAKLEELYFRLNERINKARQVHERTLPKKLPVVKGLSLAAHYQPAERLGGDYYDVVQLGNKMIIYLSDVTGHGVDGAMLSMFLKHTIRGYLSFSPEEKIHPEKILHYLSKQFRQKNLPVEYFICIFMAVLDMETMELAYTAAGFQDAPLVRLGNGERLRLISKGLFLSPAFPDELLNLREESIRLTPGTTVFFNTDGLTEQSAGNLHYGSRLPDIFHEHSHLPPQLIVRAILEDFRKFNSGSLLGKDDITFLVLQMDPNPKKMERLELLSDFAELSRLRERASSILCGDKKADPFIACLHELAANAMEHGNRLERNTKVSVEIIVTDSFIQGSVEDQGEGFRWREHINKPLELKGVLERGRGIAMSWICSRQKLFYNDKGNKAIFIIE